MQKHLAVLSPNRTAATIGQGTLAEAVAACGGELKLYVEDPHERMEGEFVLRWIDSVYEENGAVYIRLVPRAGR